MTKHSKNIYWLESSQKDLLQAVFLSGDTSLSAFERWKAQIDMSDHPDIGSFRLLPLLFHQLKTQRINDPFLMKLKGVARRNWYQNQRYFQSIAPLLQAFHQIGVNFILLYEPALALHYYTE